MTRGTSEKHLGSPFAGPSSKPWLVQRPGGIISLVAFTVTVFFRREFGQRCLTPFTLPKASACLAAYLIAMRFYAGHWSFSAAAPVPMASCLTWFAFVAAFFLYSSRQLFAAVRRRHMLSHEFSFSDGEPRPTLLNILPFVKDEWDFELFYEPAFSILLGIVLLCFHNLFGPYLVIAGLCAVQVAKAKRYARRHLELNVMDGRVATNTMPSFDDPQKLVPPRPIPTQPPADGRRRGT